MAVASFQVLCEGVCEIFGVTPPPLQPDANGLTGFTLQLQGVDISVVEAPTGPGGPSPAALVLVEFGVPPPERELQTWHALLDANFLMLDANAPSFSRNPMTGEVVLQHACTLHDTTCEDLCGRLLAIAEVAVRWRRDYFLGEPPSGPVAAPGPVHAGQPGASVFV